MPQQKPCFFYLINFVLMVWLLSYNTCFAQQLCRFYASQQTSITPGTSSIENPTATISAADTSDYATIKTPLNVGGVLSASQSLAFTTSGAAYAPLVVKIGGLANTLSVANQITIQAYNNGVPVNPAISGSVLLTMLNSSGNSRISFLPQGIYNNVRITLNSTLSLAYSINLFYAYQDVAFLPGFTVNQPVQCLEGNNFTVNNNSSVNSGSLSYFWDFGDGFTSTLTSPAHAYAANGIYTIKLTATSAGGCSGSVSQLVTVTGGLFVGNLANLDYYWVGAAGADWGTASNWRVLNSGYYYLPSLAPISGNSVYIGLPTSVGCTQPVQQIITVGANTVARCNNLNLGSNAVVNLAGSLTIDGNLTDGSSAANGIRGLPTGKLTISGTGTPTSLKFASGYQQLGALEIARTNISPVTLASPLAVFSYINLGSNNTLDSQNGNLTLKSTQNNTASVYTLPAGAVIKGTINAERFFYAGGNPTGSAAYRSYRLLSSPVSNNSYNYSGAQSAPVYNLNYLKANSIITGSANGNFDKTGNPTLYLFREDVNAGNTSFTTGNFRGITKIDPATNNLGTQSRYNLNNVSDTTIQLAAGNGVLFFFRGDRSNFTGKTTAPFAAPQDVTFTNSGVLNQGNIPVKIWFKNNLNLSYTNSPVVTNTGVSGYNLVGNPYAATIDWNTNSAKNTTNPGIVFSSAADVDTKMYVFDPLAKTFNWFDASIGTSGGNDGNPNVTQYIASGQGFFIRAKNSNATLTFTEAAKVNSETLQPLPAMLGLPQPANNSLAAIKIQLKLDSANYDYAAIYFNPGWKAEHDQDEDAIDLDGVGNTVNLSTFSADQQRLAINKMPALINQETKIVLFIKGNGGRYQLLFPQISNIPKQYKVFLKDNFLRDSVNISNNPTYDFDIDPGLLETWGEKRFELVFHLADVQPYRLLSFKGSQNKQGFILNWMVQNEFDYTSFTIEKSADQGKTYTAIGNRQSDSSGTYNFRDIHPFEGKNTFRLKQEDGNNQISYSDPIDLYWIPTVDTKTFSIYPNPASNQICVTLNKVQKGLIQARFINMQGIEVQRQNFRSENYIQSIQKLVPGLYSVELRNLTTNTLLGYQKFVKI
ncbi:MAG: PKD domain-containing protein [Sphingobacteriaceae bacterium]|nr:MAG: PKD domain-containing protein [Sphingobacteriaceae bacterium]